MSTVSQRVHEAYEALCRLEDELDGPLLESSGVLGEMDAAVVQQLQSRWELDTNIKIERELRRRRERLGVPS